tara:strand:- start:76 stop:477 length:402 start_codon:yes stop_codon:yes gene_type:complete
MDGKYLYFRTEATDANDDASMDSACWPVSSLMGMEPVGDNVLMLYFTPMTRRYPCCAAELTTAKLDNHDSVSLTLTTENTHLVAMQKIIRAINEPSTTGLIVVANDDSGAPQYLTDSGISGVGVIRVSALYAV